MVKYGNYALRSVLAIRNSMVLCLIMTAYFPSGSMLRHVGAICFCGNCPAACI